ncbi:MAG: very short patch repair endonuclease, partial [Gammaproteobacteria bacterium]|nr:very short patch repair endonuclease [Gammaproteobacteria bacterium]
HGCAKTSDPKSRVEYWQTKFESNVERDRRNQEQLARDGWRVFVAWECEVEKDDTLIARLADFLGPPRLPEPA